MQLYPALLIILANFANKVEGYFKKGTEKALKIAKTEMNNSSDEGNSDSESELKIEGKSAHTSIGGD